MASLSEWPSRAARWLKESFLSEIGSNLWIAVIAMLSAYWANLAIHWKYFGFGVGLAFSYMALHQLIVERKGRRFVSVEFRPSSGPSPDIVIGVKNLSEAREFWAQAETIQGKNTGGGFRRKSYNLKWELSVKKRLSIACGEEQNLVIARWTKDYSNQLCEVNLIGLHEMDEEVVDSARWNLFPGEDLPEFTICISVFAHGANMPARATFVVKPETYHGPLEMKRIST